MLNNFSILRTNRNRLCLRLALAGSLSLLGACAVVPKPAVAPAIPGYVFGYKTVGQGPEAEIVSGERKTWFALPKKVKLLEAKGDGKNVTFSKKGPYWIADKVATRWILYTSNGPVFAVAPESVGIVLAAEHESRHDLPRYAWRQEKMTIRFKRNAVLTKTAQRALGRFIVPIQAAHKQGWVRVSGETTRSGHAASNAKIGAARASVVSGWLMANGVVGVHNLGWTPGADKKSALIVARYQVRIESAKKIRHVFHPALVSAPIELSKKKVVEYVFETKTGDLLSVDLSRFLRQHGWSMVWQDHSDFALSYPARYTGASLQKTLRKVVQAYGVRVVLYKANHTAVIENGE